MNASVTGLIQELLRSPNDIKKTEATFNKVLHSPQNHAVQHRLEYVAAHYWSNHADHQALQKRKRNRMGYALL